MAYSLDSQQKVWILSKFGFLSQCGVISSEISFIPIA